MDLLALLLILLVVFAIWGGLSVSPFLFLVLVLVLVLFFVGGGRRRYWP